MTVPNPHREEQDVFEARFQIAALVESNKQGQPVFQVTKRGEPANDEQFLEKALACSRCELASDENDLLIVKR
jgi:hypothetical protein